MFADGTSAVCFAAETSAHPAGRRLIGYATSTACGRGMTAGAVTLEKRQSLARRRFDWRRTVIAARVPDACLPRASRARDRASSPRGSCASPLRPLPFCAAVRFRFHRDFRPQYNRRAQAGINVAVTETLFQNREGGLAGAVNGSEIAHTPVVAQSDRYAVDLVVFRRQ